MEFKKKIDLKANELFQMGDINNWDIIIENIALVLLQTKLRQYKNIDVLPKIKSGNKAVIKYSCLLPGGQLDEYILNFDILGCDDLGYDSEVSKIWRECLGACFGKEYNDYVATKLSKINNLHSC